MGRPLQAGREPAAIRPNSSSNSVGQPVRVYAAVSGHSQIFLNCHKLSCPVTAIAATHRSTRLPRGRGPADQPPDRRPADPRLRRRRRTYPRTHPSPARHRLGRSGPHRPDRGQSALQRPQVHPRGRAGPPGHHHRRAMGHHPGRRHRPRHPAGELPHVFDRFFRGRAARPVGSGIGLTVVSELATAHGGTVEAASEPGLRV